MHAIRIDQWRHGGLRSKTARGRLASSFGANATLKLDGSSRGTIDGMVGFMDAHPEVGIAGCRTVGPDGSYQKTTALMYSMGTEVANVLCKSAVFRDGIDEALTTWKSVGWLNGHFLLVRAQ
ncbi:MAG: hypothetical protein WCC90_03600, partial [Methylocella sp.]